MLDHQSYAVAVGQSDAHARVQLAPIVLAEPAAADASDAVPRGIRAALKRVFGVEIEACARCSGKLKVVASTEEPTVIAKILARLERSAADQHQSELPLGARAPSAQSRLL